MIEFGVGEMGTPPQLMATPGGIVLSAHICTGFMLTRTQAEQLNIMVVEFTHQMECGSWG